MILSAEATEAAKNALREVTPPPGVTKEEWLAEHGSFALIAGAIAAAAPFLEAPAPRVLTTEDELNSPDVFDSLCIVPEGGPLRVATSSSNGVTYWQEPGYAGEYSSAELLAHFASIGVAPAFTVVKG